MPYNHLSSAVNQARKPLKLMPTIKTFSGLHQINRYPQNLHLRAESRRKSERQSIMGDRKLQPQKSSLVCGWSYWFLPIPSALIFSTTYSSFYRETLSYSQPIGVLSISQGERLPKHCQLKAVFLRHGADCFGRC